MGFGAIAEQETALYLWTYKIAALTRTYCDLRIKQTRPPLSFVGKRLRGLVEGASPDGALCHNKLKGATIALHL